MGSCMSKEYREAVNRTRVIEKACARDYRIESQKFKLLLMGLPGSGKSTVMKQMRTLYGLPYDLNERLSFRKHMQNSILESIETMCLLAKDLFPNDRILRTPEFQLLCPLASHSPYFVPENLTSEKIVAISFLWRSDAFQMLWSRRNLFGLPDFVGGFLDRLEEISKPSFVPDINDIMAVHVKSWDIMRESFEIDSRSFIVYNNGGQHNERKKWIHYFYDISGILFLASLADYDVNLTEDGSMNRMMESIDFFHQIVREKSFKNTTIILLLNKADLFREKIKTIPIKSIPCFHDYAGGNDFDAGVAYFVKKYKERLPANVEVFHHVITALDRTSLRGIFDACQHVIVKLQLLSSGFIS